MSVLFVLDANVFIEASRRYYAFDLAPGFWDSLVLNASQGKICSIDRVMTELKRGKDELSEWARGKFADWFVSTDNEKVIQSYAGIMNWAQSQKQFSDAAKSEFANVADGWLVAYAHANASVVVTHEVYDPYVKKKVPIPNICQAFGVDCVDTFAMLRRLKVQLR